MSERYVGQLHSADDMIAAVEEYGFLPFFQNEIPGFSVEELCVPELWFADEADGPWEWKGPAARSGRPYGWGIAEYATPEELFGYDFISSAYQRDPQESRERILRHLHTLLPSAEGKQLERILKG